MDDKDVFEKSMEALDQMNFNVANAQKLSFCTWLTECSLKYNVPIEEVLKHLEETINIMKVKKKLI